MKYCISFSIAVLITLRFFTLSQSAHAASPRFIFDPIEVHAQRCAALGTAWYGRIAETLRVAQAGTTNLLPRASWEQLQASLSSQSDSAALPAADDASCEEYVKYYSDPKLSARIRAMVVAGLVIKEYTGCAAAFPELSNSIRSAWITAFNRNGLDPMEQLFDESIQTSWRKPTEDLQFRQECEKLIDLLGSENFDQVASEHYIKRFLSPNVEPEFFRGSNLR